MPLRFPWSIAAWLVSLYHGAVNGVMAGLHSVAKHTGIPIVLIAAVGLVISYRVVRRGARLAFELAVALALVLLATMLGWVHW